MEDEWKLNGGLWMECLSPQAGRTANTNKNPGACVQLDRHHSGAYPSPRRRPVTPAQARHPGAGRGHHACGCRIKSGMTCIRRHSGTAKRHSGAGRNPTTSVWSSLRGIGPETGQLIAAARPRRSGFIEYPRLRLDIGIDVQRSGGNEHQVHAGNFCRQWSAALGAERTREPLRLGYFVGFDQSGITGPCQRSVLQEQVGRMAGARRLAATRAVTVHEAAHFAGGAILQRTAKAGSC